MSWIHFQSIEMLHLVWLLPLLGLLLALARRRAAAAMRRLTALEDRLAPVDLRRRRLRQLLFLSSLGLIIFALARPGWNAETVVVHQEGRDVVFVVDVSRSMQAEDLAPNRLERAKLAILDSLPVLENDRVALVAFAGRAVVVCPLTRDYGFFRWAVEGLSPLSGGGGGTLIGDAIRKVTADLFDPLEKRYKDLILISDGEDQDSYPAEAAAAAAEQGVRIIAIGLGDDRKGSRIPVEDSSGHRSFLTYEGREVWTRLEAETMRSIALATPGGRYLHAATGAFDLGAIYRDLITGGGRDLGPVEITRYQEKYQLFLMGAFVLLVAQSLLSERKGFSERKGESGRKEGVETKGEAGVRGEVKRARAAAPLAALCLGAAVLFQLRPVPAAAGGVAELVAAGNEALEAGLTAEAISRYETARDRSTGSAVPLFNMGVALMRQENYPAALKAFQSIPPPRGEMAPLVHYNQGNVFARLGQMMLPADPESAMRLYRLSLSAYTRALALDPGLRPAAYNLEVVRGWVAELEARSAGSNGSSKEGEAQRKGGDGGEGAAPNPGGSSEEDPSAGSSPEGPQGAPAEDLSSQPPGDETARDILEEERQRREQAMRWIEGETSDGRPNW